MFASKAAIILAAADTLPCELILTLETYNAVGEASTEAVDNNEAEVGFIPTLIALTEPTALIADAMEMRPLIGPDPHLVVPHLELPQPMLLLTFLHQPKYRRPHLIERHVNVLALRLELSYLSLDCLAPLAANRLDLSCLRHW